MMRTGYAAAVLVLVLGLGACSSLLPKSDKKTTSPWKSFEEAKAAFDSIELGATDREMVERVGFDPARTPNVKLLNYSQIANGVLPGQWAMRSEDVPVGIKKCLRAQDHCIGYELEESRLKRRRVGNFWTDFFNFKRDTLVTGWEFKALIVLVDDMAVFKQWSGQPHIEEAQTRRNPLGPLQGIGEKTSTFRQ